MCPGITKDYYLGLAAPAYALLHLFEAPSITTPGTPFELNAYEPVPGSWSVRQGALWATRSYNGSHNLGNIHAQESTELDLFHKPGH